MNKKGITMVSLVIYVILLFGVITFVTITSNNINKRVFDERGLAINILSADKLQYNMINSSKESIYANVYNKKIVFSNGDAYNYDENKKVVYKNETALVDNVNSYTVTTSNRLININITFNKYLNELQRNIKIYVEE